MTDFLTNVVLQVLTSLNKCLENSRNCQKTDTQKDRSSNPITDENGTDFKTHKA